VAGPAASIATGPGAISLFNYSYAHTSAVISIGHGGVTEITLDTVGTLK